MSETDGLTDFFKELKEPLERHLRKKVVNEAGSGSSGVIYVSHRKDPDVVSEVTVDGPIEADVLVKISGLAPRDGSLACVYRKGRRLAHDTIIEPGEMVSIDNDSIIEYIQIDHYSTDTGRNRIGAGELPDGAIGHVPGAKVGDLRWVVRSIQHTSRRDPSIVHAQCHSFRLGEVPYKRRDLVRARPAPDGRNALLFDPRTEEWTIHLSIETPPNMDSDEVIEIYGGLLWTVRLLRYNESEGVCKGVLVPSLTHNPRLRR